MSTTKELLQILLDNPHYFRTGLCQWIHSLTIGGKLTSVEYRNLSDYIDNNRISKYDSFAAYKYRDSNHWWPPGKIKYRLKWIKKHIKLNSNE